MDMCFQTLDKSRGLAIIKPTFKIVTSYTLFPKIQLFYNTAFYVIAYIAT